MNSFAMMQMQAVRQDNTWMTRAYAVLIALVFHALAYIVWMQQNSTVIEPSPVLSLSVEMAMPRQQLEHLHPAPQPIQKYDSVQNAEPETAVTQSPVATAPVEQAATKPAPAKSEAPPAPVTVTDPEYKASYLKNAPPTYPLAARRMGMQGKVLLHVEVLANGASGRVEVSTSSGYAMLDNAAMNAVKSWRFAPATRAGQAVDKWFIIPVQFSLTESPA